MLPRGTPGTEGLYTLVDAIQRLGGTIPRLSPPPPPSRGLASPPPPPGRRPPPPPPGEAQHSRATLQARLVDHSAGKAKPFRKSLPCCTHTAYHNPTSCFCSVNPPGSFAYGHITRLVTHVQNAIRRSTTCYLAHGTRLSAPAGVRQLLSIKLRSLHHTPRHGPALQQLHPLRCSPPLPPPPHRRRRGYGALHTPGLLRGPAGTQPRLTHTASTAAAEHRGQVRSPGTCLPRRDRLRVAGPAVHGRYGRGACRTVRQGR